MKSFFLLSALAFSMVALAADPVVPANPHAGMRMPTGGMSGVAHEIPLTQQGRVLSTINVPMYTYIEVEQGKAKVWLAAATIALKKGDSIRFDNGMAMSNFYSKTLKRTFSSIMFVNRVVLAK